jgi:hypothetical protein
MQTMATATRTILVQLQSLLIVATVLLCGVIALLALGTGERDDTSNSFLGHKNTQPSAV